MSVRARFAAGQGIGVRRVVLHEHLMECAQEAGVTLHWRTPVMGISSAGVAIPGKTIAARWIIGADGIHSRVRRWAGLERPHRLQLRYAFRQHYHVAPWSDCTEVHWSRNAQAYVTPVSSTDVCVVLISSHPQVRFTALDAEFPRLAECLASSTCVRSERGAVTFSHRLQNVYRGRVALIGDASGSVDAITGEGICLTFRQAMVLADSLAADDLRRYQTAHRRLARRPALMGRMLLLLDRQPKVRRRAMRAMAAHPDLFARLLAVHVGDTSAAHFAATGVLLGWRLLAA